MVSWSWNAANGHGPESESDNRLWSLRLPLTNGDKLLGYLYLYREIQRDDVHLEINYLCTLFQKDLASATQRLLTDATPERRKFAAHG
jgi:hypothetical protein